jgi:hypothetical protein
MDHVAKCVDDFRNRARFLCRDLAQLAARPTDAALCGLCFSETSERGTDAQTGQIGKSGSAIHGVSPACERESLAPDL